MGVLDDLAMGLGFKERTEDYDARTANTIAANRVAADRGDATNVLYLAQARNPDHESYYGNYQPAMRDRADYLERVGGETYNPQVASSPDDADFLQNFFFSAPLSETNPASPRRYALGPLDFDEPIMAYSPLAAFSRILGGFYNSNRVKSPLTSSAFSKFDGNGLY
jgi:hypothetical protein